MKSSIMGNLSTQRQTALWVIWAHRGRKHFINPAHSGHIWEILFSYDQ